ncbi:hypothetical protein GCM10027073_11750 [Streptomyces chlorus]
MRAVVREIQVGAVGAASYGEPRSPGPPPNPDRRGVHRQSHHQARARARAEAQRRHQIPEPGPRPPHGGPVVRGPLRGTTNSKIIPGRSANVTTPKKHFAELKEDHVRVTRTRTSAQ